MYRIVIFTIVVDVFAQEQILDYVFSHLGIDTEGSVDHPVVMTEPVCNPGYCRESEYRQIACDV